MLITYLRAEQWLGNGWWRNMESLGRCLGRWLGWRYTGCFRLTTHWFRACKHV